MPMVLVPRLAFLVDFPPGGARIHGVHDGDNVPFQRENGDVRDNENR